MNVTTTKPLTEFYNSKIKGNDLTESQALNAYIEKRIDRATLDHVLDNLGVRDDIRDIKIEMDRKGLSTEQAVKAFIEGKIDAAKFNQIMDREKIREDERSVKVELARPDLTEADLQEGYNNGLFSEQDGVDFYKEKGYEGFELKAKMDLLKDQRLFKFRQKLEAAYFHGYVIGTVTPDEFSQYMASINYTDLEIQMEVRRADILRRSHTEKHLTRGEILRLVADGSMQATDGLNRLVQMGLNDADARRLLADSVLRHAVSMVPSKIRDACTGPDVERNLLSAAITTVTELDPQYVIANKDFFQQAKCILEQYTQPSCGGTTPPPQGPPPPSTLVAQPQDGKVVLSWQPAPGLVDYVVYRRSIGDATFFPINVPSTLLTYTDGGTTKGQVYIYVVRSRLNGVESVDSNEVQVMAV